jgi:ABC-type enterobactin transport system permease subunit
MRRILLVLAVAIVMAAMLVAGPVSIALAAEHHPPKFSVKSTQCSSGANQPNCPGSH